jgi:hypothetical protein
MDNKKVDFSYVVSITTVAVIEGTAELGPDGVPTDIILNLKESPVVKGAYVPVGLPKSLEGVQDAIKSVCLYRTLTVANALAEKALPEGQGTVARDPRPIDGALN